LPPVEEKTEQDLHHILIFCDQGMVSCI